MPCEPLCELTVSVFYLIMWSCFFWTVNWPRFKIAFGLFAHIVVVKPNCFYEIIYHNMTVLPVYCSPLPLTVNLMTQSLASEMSQIVDSSHHFYLRWIKIGLEWIDMLHWKLPSERVRSSTHWIQPTTQFNLNLKIVFVDTSGQCHSSCCAATCLRQLKFYLDEIISQIQSY